MNAADYDVPWHRGPLASYDCETSGVNVFEDRIVSAALITPSGALITWLSDADGVEIPESASRVHGITTEHARRYGRPAKEVIEDVTATLAVSFVEARAALVVMNAPFDLSLLNAECARHGVQPLGERIGGLAPIVDPLVLDRAIDRYRKGKRTLESLAAHYGVKLDGAHQADADALAALGVSRALADRYEELQVPARVLHGWQVRWHERWASGFQEHLRKSKPDAVVDGSWPLRPVGGAL